MILSLAVFLTTSYKVNLRDFRISSSKKLVYWFHANICRLYGTFKMRINTEQLFGSIFSKRSNVITSWFENFLQRRSKKNIYWIRSDWGFFVCARWIQWSRSCFRNFFFTTHKRNRWKVWLRHESEVFEGCRNFDREIKSENILTFVKNLWFFSESIIH